MWSQQLFIAELFLLMHHPCIVRCSFTRLGVIQWLKCIIFGHVDSFIICLGIGQALQLPCASVNCQVAAKECQNLVFDPPPHTHVRHQHAVVIVHARCWLSGKQHIHPQQISLFEYDVIKLPNSSEEKKWDPYVQPSKVQKLLWYHYIAGSVHATLWVLDICARIQAHSILPVSERFVQHQSMKITLVCRTCQDSLTVSFPLGAAFGTHRTVSSEYTIKKKSEFLIY